MLQPGTHWLFDGIDHLRVETFALEQPSLTHGLADYLMAKKPEVVAAEFVCLSEGAMAEQIQVHNPVNATGKPRIVFIHGLDPALLLIAATLQGIRASGHQVISKLRKPNRRLQM